MDNIPPENIAKKFEELNGWRNKRLNEYGQIGDQLNLLWDDIDSGLLGENAKTGTWYLHVKSVKNNITKPNIEVIEQEIQALFKAQLTE